MQESFDFGGTDLSLWRTRLTRCFGPMQDVKRRSPTGQLVKSMISSRTRDAVSLAAYRRLGKRWPRSVELAKARPRVVQRVIADVTFADVKAERVPAALAIIGRERPDFRLDFLRDLPLADALAWLERLPGVGRKVAAATLNASTLRRPVFIVDTHVHRVLQRLGFVGPRADPKAASEALTSAAHGWDGDDLLELFVQMKLLGQTICRSGMACCQSCPLNGSCLMSRHN
jgi:endonuclease-3